MAFTYIADTQYIRDYGLIRQSVSDAIIAPAARHVQTLYIAPYVEGYSGLLNSIKTGTETPEELQLLEELRPAIAAYVSAWLTEDLNAQMGGNGTGAGASEAFFQASGAATNLRYLQLMRQGDALLNLAVGGGECGRRRIQHAPGIIYNSKRGGCCER